MQLGAFRLSLLFDRWQRLLDKFAHFLGILFTCLTGRLLRRQPPAAQVFPHPLQGQFNAKARRDQLSHRLPGPCPRGDVLLGRRGLHHDAPNLTFLIRCQDTARAQWTPLRFDIQARFALLSVEGDPLADRVRTHAVIRRGIDLRQAQVDDRPHDKQAQPF
jgi:hypothetical protein